MSTYLVAFMVSEFDFRQSDPELNNVVLRVWARQEAIDQVQLHLLQLGILRSESTESVYGNIMSFDHQIVVNWPFSWLKRYFSSVSSDIFVKVTIDSSSKKTKEVKLTQISIVSLFCNCLPQSNVWVASWTVAKYHIMVALDQCYPYVSCELNNDERFTLIIIKWLHQGR